jgi:5-formyltetrahydrofolate cyclo-ligase
MNKLISQLHQFFLTKLDRIKEEKRQIRIKVRDLKELLSEEQKQKEADAVFGKIEYLPEFKAANSILIYWSTPDELPTHDIIKKWRQAKLIILPSIKGDKLVLKSYTSEEKLIQKVLGIWEPNLSQTYQGKVDLVIVPGIAFDQNRNRLGRGKGYYDRFFKKNKLTKIGVGFDFQLFNSIPTEKTDVQMDKIITPSNTIE